LDILQIANNTGLNRYPEVYRRLACLFRDNAAPRVLVFGVSRGLEAVTLACSIPNAEILGVDVDEAALETATSITGSWPRITLAGSDEGRLRTAAPFDIIVVHAVLCLHPERLTMEAISQSEFSRAEATLAMLTDLLAPGGVLSVVSCNFDVLDFDLGRPIYALDSDMNTIVPKFGQDGSKIVQVRNLDGIPMCRHSPGVDSGRARRAVSGSLFSTTARENLPWSSGDAAECRRVRLDTYDALAFHLDVPCRDWQPMPAEILVEPSASGDLRLVHRLATP